MKYIRWIGTVILVLSMGYLSGFGLFADSNTFGTIVVVLIFFAGSAGVGALFPERWQLSALCSWGAILLVVLEISSSIGREPVPGQQSTAQVLLIGLGALGLALLGGYFGSRLRTKE